MVDTSAIMAILLDEPERPAFRDAIAKAMVVRISAVTRVEASAVARGRGKQELDTRLIALIASFAAEISEVNAAQTDIALMALEKFGKGRHPAKLNLGDTFSYALAMHLREPLLFKGRDFALTDVVPAV